MEEKKEQEKVANQNEEAAVYETANPSLLSVNTDVVAMNSNITRKGMNEALHIAGDTNTSQISLKEAEEAQ